MSERPDNNSRRKLVGAILVGIVWLILAVVALLGPALSPQDPYRTYPTMQFRSPGPDHLLGTDELGRDILSRFLWGGRATLGGAILAFLVAAAIGSLFSLFALLNYRLLDRVVGYGLDVMLAFPGLLIALIAVTLLGKGSVQISLAVGISLAPTCARLLRGSVTGVRYLPYVDAAYALGADRWWVAGKHIVRNIVPPMSSVAAVILAWALLDCAALEFLGLAGSPELPTWGSMIGVGRSYFREAVWQVLAPGIALSLSVLGLMLLGNLRRLLAHSEG